MSAISYFCFQAEDVIRDLVLSRGLGDVYKRQGRACIAARCRYDGHLLPVARVAADGRIDHRFRRLERAVEQSQIDLGYGALLKLRLLYTSDAADERSRGDLGGSRIIKKKNA